jgi:hypothetical protein
MTATGNARSERCRLEPTATTGVNSPGTSGPVRLEPAKTVMVLWLGQSMDPRAVAFFEEVLR